MPIEKCEIDGKSGWRYGKSGTCYTGKNAKQKAIKQGVAIHYKTGEPFKGNENLTEDFLNELEKRTKGHNNE